MAKWFTSDHHYGHQNIVDYVPRPFKDVTHMNETMVERWNENVSNNDDIYVVGDFAMGQIEQTLRYAERLQGNKYLIPGNHDRCWGGHGKSEKWTPIYEAAGFTVLSSSITMDIGDENVELCHFPFSGDSKGQDRYSGNRPVDVGQWLIHGHTHSNQRSNGRMIHVGVDAWSYYPVSERQILDILDG